MDRKNRHAPKSSLEDLETASRADLKTLFHKEFGWEPAARTSLTFMRQNLAWAAPARAQGVKPAKKRDQLIRALSRQLNGKTKGIVPYRPGTRLVREWRGAVYQIAVLEKGYAWEGRTYGNLTQIATEITGTKWSGPRFFGLKGGQHGAD